MTSELKYKINIDLQRNELLTDFGKATLDDRYLMPGESYQDMYARVASAYADTQDHAQRLYDYMSKLWFSPATPILSNGGTNRGLPISCFLNEASDSLTGIIDLWKENVFLASNGGGIGSYWGNLRGLGERVRGNSKTTGIVPFVKVMDSITLAVGQGALRRGSAAVYLDVSHPEVEEFIEIRRPTGGDPNRKALNLNHGLMVSDAFMQAVEDDSLWELKSPKTKEVISTVSARHLWMRILNARIETGEPYLIFSDAVTKGQPNHHKILNLNVHLSNLCTEILLPTGKDHHGNERTAVCCLSSLNLEKWFDWHKEDQFIEDVMRFLDNILDDFIVKAPTEIAKAAYSAMRERSVGLGVMGYHSFLQGLNVPYESAVAKVWNMKMFKHIKKQADAASIKLAEEKGACPDAMELGILERFSHKLAIAPTASISIICGGSSPGIEPNVANAYLHKTLSGSFSVRNKYLKKLLAEKGKDDDETWSKITLNKGSVQKLRFLSADEKAVFKTAHELDQRWVIEHAADRTPYICQSQSVNLFLPGDVHKRDLHQIHMLAWKKGLKSLYYCRSLAVNRADSVSKSVELKEMLPQTDYSECLACQ